MEAHKATDEGNDVSQRAERTADNLRDALDGWNVTVFPPAGMRDRIKFVAYSDEDHVSTNGYSKGRVINTVLREVPALEVDSTEDGDMAVSFRYVNE